MVHRQGNRRRTRCLATISHSWPQPGNAGNSHREANWPHDRKGAYDMHDKKASTHWYGHGAKLRTVDGHCNPRSRPQLHFLKNASTLLSCRSLITLGLISLGLVCLHVTIEVFPLSREGVEGGTY